MKKNYKAILSIITAATGLLLMGNGPAMAQDATVLVELNKLEQRKEGDVSACRLWFALTNRQKVSFQAFEVELVIFDAKGLIHARHAVEFGPLTASKIRVRLLDLTTIPCAEIGRVLINDVYLCRNQAGKPLEDCLSRIEIRRRTDGPDLL